MPGVHAVITWKDVPLLEYGHLSALGIPADEPLLAKDEVRYLGQPIALVAAESEELAAAAVDAIEVGFEERPALFDIRQAFDSDAPKIHQWGNWYPHFEGEMDRRQIRKGDIDWAFDEADTIVQGVYRPAAIEHAPIETQVCQVVPEPNGRLTIYSCTQALYFSLGVVAAHLQVPLNRLKIVGGTTGGGFGGKVDTATETMTCLLVLKANRPVKWRWTREEEFLCSSTRAPWHMELATAMTKDGWILGQKMLTLHDSGAYARFSPYGLTKHSFHHTGAYSIPNLHFDGYVVFTNRTPTTAMRGFGVTSVSFAVETHMNRVAKELGLDPIEIRMKNANRIGDTSPNGIAYTDPSTIDTLKAIAEAIGHELPADYRTMTNEPRAGELLPEHLVSPGRIDGGSLMAKHTGRGIAAIEYPTGMNQNGDPSQCWIKVKPDGRIDVFAGTADIGNGSKTIQSQIVAETIGVPYDWITYDNSNTDSSPVCTGTFASRATFVAGKAAEKAALQVKQKILEIAGKEMEIDPADLEIVDGEVIAKGAPQTKLGVGDVAAAATWGHGELITGTGAQLKPYAAIIDPETGEVDLPPHSAISYAACAAEVEVDDETGEVRVTRLQQCYDVGRALNPSHVEGQIEGGAMMGLGLGVLENCYPYYPSVEHRGGAFGSYLAPGMEDMPQIDTIMIENPSADGPYGAKGIGEMANNPQPPAIAAAVYDAIGVWVTELPITPERVLRALEAKAEPRREGKKVVFDEELSVNAVSSGGMRFEVPA